MGLILKKTTVSRGDIDSVYQVRSDGGWVRHLKMKDTSASALVWFSGIVMVIGWLVMSPSGAVFSFVLSAIFAIVPAVFGTAKIRLVAIVLLIIALFFAADRYPEFRSERERLSSGRDKNGMQAIERQ
jgi:hypothetical protein